MADPKTRRLRKRIGPMLAVGAAAALLGLQSDSPPTTPSAVSRSAGTRGTSGHSRAFARVNLRELAALPQTPPLARAEEDEREEQIRPPKLPLPRDARLRLDPRRLRPEAAAAFRVASPPLATSFQALVDNQMVFPPDTEGAIGPNHVVTTLNSQTRIQDHGGKELLLVTFDAFWSKVTSGGFLSDPKILYDPSTDRWIAAAIAGLNTAEAAVLVGVSQSGDPTGTWNLYSVAADPQGKLWADFPSLGFNRDWVAIQVNMWTVADSVADAQFQQSQIYVFDKANLVAGGPDARHTLFTRDDLGTGQVPAATYDPGEPNLYFLEDWNGNDGSVGSLQLFAVSGPVGSEEFRSISFPATEDVWDDASPDGKDFAPQMGTAAKISVQTADFTHVIVRNGLITAAQTVFLPSGSPQRSSIQWWQLTGDGFVVQRGRVDDPASQLFFAFPSVAANVNNDLLVGYSEFSASSFPSGAYAFRAAADPSGTLRDNAILKSGETFYIKTGSGTRNRWGDYSATAIDPGNGTDLWTIQEYALKPVASAAGSWATWWGRIVAASGPPVPLPSASFTAPAAAVAGQPVQFTDGSSGATQWFWSFGDGEGSTERNPVHSFGFDGTLTVTETAANQTGAVSASRTIAVSPPAKLHPQPLPESGGRPRVVTPRGR
jgi:PKD domain